ncbi:putative lysine-specific demethylase JMJD5 [Spatholobus suberectus]|nr:putative lysine-specific demethylase JMJD5 [Spatholobus suberectus]
MREITWEQLWHSVLPVWCNAYSMVCLHMKALRVLDLGIIMGRILLLDSVVEKVSKQTRRTIRVFHLGNSEHRLVDCKLDMALVLQLLPVKYLPLKLMADMEKFLKDHYLASSLVIIRDYATIEIMVITLVVLQPS